jgi:alpha-L-fucosidase
VEVSRKESVCLNTALSIAGNILINIGPTKEGTLVPIFQERLLDLGKWLSINGEAIYESSPWTTQNDTLTYGVWYTTNDPSVYAIVLNWPDDNVVNLGSVVSLFANADTEVTLLGNEEQLSWQVNDDGVAVNFPDRAKVASEWAWVIKITP